MTHSPTPPAASVASVASVASAQSAQSAQVAGAPTWPAPRASGPLDAVVDVPGSKSLTNRFLVLAALANGPSSLHGALSSQDSHHMAGALRALGADVHDDGPVWQVSPVPLDAAQTPGTRVVDCGLAGTVMRFVPPIAALLAGDTLIDGAPAARARPMGPIIEALRDLGVDVTDEGRGTLPFTVHGRGPVRGGALEVDASGSSQFVSGLLLAAPRFTEGLHLRHVGARLPSGPHIRMTVEVLRAAGVEVDDSVPGEWTVRPSTVRGGDVVVEPDLSNAAPFLCAALVAGGTVRVPRWPSSSTQPGMLLPEILTAMGATVRLDGDVLSVTGDGTVHGVDLDLHAAGELTPAIAALAALADSPTTLRGVAHIRGHETDRLTALATEINRLGGDVRETADGLVLTPAPLHGGVVQTYQDHRMATAGALLGLRVSGVEVVDVATTAKTMPGFVDLWTGMLGGR